MGQSSSESDSELLNYARQVETYGLRPHPATDASRVLIELAASHSGVVVLQNNARVNTFSWSLIRKLSFKKKRFLVKLTTPIVNDKRYSNAGDVLVFTMTSRDACKSFWRRCIEHHSFFRSEIYRQAKAQSRLLRGGSTYRYSYEQRSEAHPRVNSSLVYRSGKTQKQLHDQVSGGNFHRASFTRVSRRRTTAPSRHNAPFSTPQNSSHTVPNKFSRSTFASSVPTYSDMKPSINSSGSALLQDADTLRHETGNDVSMTTSAGQNDSTERSWRDESGDLRGGRSSPAPQDKMTDSEGNPLLRDPDILNGVDCASSRVGDSNANDNSKAVSRDAMHRVGMSIPIGSSGNQSFTYPLPPPPPPPPQGAEYFSYDLPSPPPLPPKLGMPVSNQPCLKNGTVSQIEPDSPDHVASSELSGSRFHSEESIPGVKEPRTPSQYEVTERQLIKAGFYSAPSKPPISEPSPPVISALEEDFDPIQQALDDLQRTASSLVRSPVDNFESGSSMETNSVEGPSNIHRENKNPPLPIGRSSAPSPPSDPVYPDEHFLSPIFLKGGVDFSVELEASFDRIRSGFPIHLPEQDPVRSRKELLSSAKAESEPRSRDRECSASQSSRRNVRV